jgi:ABC-type branched-subunit amino acid transport system substrate-binding protein
MSGLWTRRRLLEQAAALGTVAATVARPAEAAGAPEKEVRVGYIAPVGGSTGRPTSSPAAREVAAYAGLLGAREGGAETNYTAGLMGARVTVMERIARTPQEAVAQAGALGGQHASALLGGFDSDTARALSRFALEHEILFFNVGATEDRLRNEDCARFTFHIEASDAMYLDALADWLIRGLAFLVDEDAPQGVRVIRRTPARAWFLVTEDTPVHRTRRARLVAQFAQRHWGGRIVADLTVTEQEGFAPALRAISGSRPDIVFLMQSPAEQLRFYTEYEQAHLPYEVTGFPDPVTQTRTFFGALLRAAPRTARGNIRMVSWEPTFGAIGGPQLAQRFQGRWKQPMDGPAWTSWLAVKIVWDAFTHARDSRPGALQRYLESAGALFDGYQGIGLTFRPWDHQLRHPVMVSRLTQLNADEAHWAEMIGQFPNIVAPGRDPTQVLDQLGDTAQTTRCRWR